MRTFLAATGLFIAVGMTAAQPPVNEFRYGVRPLTDSFPQSSPKEALSSTILAIERGRFEYLAAYLIEPSFIDAKVVERVSQLEPFVDQEFRLLRETQRASRQNIPLESLLPEEPNAFASAVRNEARQRAFRQVVSDIRTYMSQNSDLVRTLRRFLREGTELPAGDVATFSIKELPNQAVFLKKIGERWHVEDRQSEGQPAKK